MVTDKIAKNVYEIKNRLGETCGNQMEFYEDNEELDIQEEINSQTSNNTLKTKTKIKAKPRGRPCKTHVLVKRNTVK